MAVCCLLSVSGACMAISDETPGAPAPVEPTPLFYMGIDGGMFLLRIRTSLLLWLIGGAAAASVPWYLWPALSGGVTP